MPPTQAESVIKNIIREIGQECAAHGEIVPETLVAFMVRINIFVNYCFIKKFFSAVPILLLEFCDVLLTRCIENLWRLVDKLCLCVLSHVQLFATAWTVACEAPLSMGFFQAKILFVCFLSL